MKSEASKSPLLIPDRFLLVQGANCRSSKARSPLCSSSLLSKKSHIYEKQPPPYTHPTAKRDAPAVKRKPGQILLNRPFLSCMDKDGGLPSSFSFFSALQRISFIYSP